MKTSKIEPHKNFDNIFSTKHFNLKFNIPPANSTRLAGGPKEKCNNTTRLGKKIRPSQAPLKRQDMGDLVYDVKKFLRQNPITVDPTKFSSWPELFKAVENHAEQWQRINNGKYSTIQHRMRCARRMRKHPAFPINFYNLTFEQFTAYMTCREKIEHAGHWALMNDLQTVQMFLTAYGKPPINTKNPPASDQVYWYYKLPPAEEKEDRDIPSPNEVHKLIAWEYSTDAYANALYQTLMAHNHWIGWRVPSEPCVLKVKDVNFEHGTIRITEPKKRKRKRIIMPDEVILTGKTRKSFKNYLDKWRPQVECAKSEDAFYLTPTGLPFNPRHLGHELSERGKLAYPAFTPYGSRHWNACAMLVRMKIETGNFDKHFVQKWLGHDRPATTDTYVDQAIGLYKKYPFDWIKRTLKFDVYVEGESALKSKQRPKTPVSTGKPGEGRSGLSGI